MGSAEEGCGGSETESVRGRRRQAGREDDDAEVFHVLPAANI